MQPWPAPAVKGTAGVSASAATVDRRAADAKIHGLAHGGTADDLRATGETVQVHVAEARGSPAPVPDWIVRLFEAYEGRPLRQGRP
jgi:acyl-CoA thioesterase FadM